MKSQELSIESGKRLVIRPVRSRFILTLVTALHVVALTLLFFTDLDVWLLIILGGLILLNLQRSDIFSTSSFHCLSFKLGETLQLQINGSWNEIDVIESFVTSWLIVLQVRTLNDSCLHSLVYSADSIDRYSFRQLRIYLNHFNVASQAK